MATSGSIDYTQTRDEIIIGALQLLNVIGAAAPTVSDLNMAANRLKAMVKSWQAEGLHIWAKAEGVIFLTPGTNTYSISSAGTSAHSCALEDFVKTTISADEAAAQTTISVTSSSGMVAADKIGIVLDDQTIHWSTVSSVPGATSVIINNALSSQASAGNMVYVYTNRLNRPLRILDARKVSGSGTSESETVLTRYGHEEYFRTPSKNSEGAPSGWYYDPQLTTGKLYIWPTPDDGDTYIRITYERSLEDLDDATNTADFPQEWIETLTYNLAVRIAPAFGKSGEIIDDIKLLAALTKQTAMNFDREIGNISIKLDEY